MATRSNSSVVEKVSLRDLLSGIAFCAALLATYVNYTQVPRDSPFPAGLVGGVLILVFTLSAAALVRYWLIGLTALAVFWATLGVCDLRTPLADWSTVVIACGFGFLVHAVLFLVAHLSRRWAA